MEHGRKIRVMMLTSVLDRRGAERMILKLICGLDPRRYEIRTVCLRPQTPFLEEFKKNNCEVTVLGMERYFQIGPLIRLYRMMKTWRPDLVHTHLYRDAVYGRVIARLAGVPGVVSTLQNSYVWRPWSQLFLDRVTAVFADRITAVSDAVKRFAVEREHMPAAKLVTVYNAIDHKRFRVPPGVRMRVRRELGIGPDEIAIGSTGALTHQKGYGYLLEAAAAIHRTYPEVRFFIGGEGDLEKELPARRDRLGLEGTVEFLGFRSDVPELLSAFDIYVLPSLYEGLPVALVEAMAAGLPSVVTDVDGNIEAIGENEAGIAVEPRDPAALGKALGRLIEDQDLRRKMARCGRRRAEEIFDVRVMVENYENVYRFCLEKTSGRPE